MTTRPSLTPRQALERRIENDARNVREVRSGPCGRTWAVVIADCAWRLFEARAIDRELERRAEANLRAALEGWE